MTVTDSGSDAEKSKHILLVDDDGSYLKMMQSWLSPYYKLTIVNSGMQAITYIATNTPDLILLDLMMPGIDGFEVIRRLREDPATSDIQIVILSALNSNEDVIKGFNAGANDFIMKPIIMEKLLTCVVTQMSIVEGKKRA